MTLNSCEVASPFRVVATCHVFEPGFRGGGPIRAVARLVDTVSECADVILIVGDRDLGDSKPYPGLSGQWIRRPRSRVFYLDASSVRQCWRLWRELHSEPFDLLYVNSFWNPIYTIIPIVAARLGLVRVKKILIAPRGEFSPGALSVKPRKKQLFLKLWEPLLRRMDVGWHASTEREAAEIRSTFTWGAIEINQDQVSLPDEPVPARYPREGPARLVFIGRISVMKNLDLTLSVLRGLAHPVDLDIYGPIEDKRYWAECQEQIGQLPECVRVNYKGALPPEEVRDTFADYDAFVFPTRGENFGYVIAESLSASCPVICSDQTLWTDVLESGGGSAVSVLTEQGLRLEVERIAGMTPGARFRMKVDAGDAYRLWRKTVKDLSILDQVRLGKEIVADA